MTQSTSSTMSQQSTSCDVWATLRTYLTVSACKGFLCFQPCECKPRYSECPSCADCLCACCSSTCMSQMLMPSSEARRMSRLRFLTITCNILTWQRLALQSLLYQHLSGVNIRLINRPSSWCTLNKCYSCDVNGHQVCGWLVCGWSVADCLLSMWQLLSAKCLILFTIFIRTSLWWCIWSDKASCH